MQRTIARLLLLFSVAGTVIPLAGAVSTAPLPLCCIRHKHACHAAVGSNSSPAEVHESCCSRQGCGHAVITARWAHPGMQAGSFLARALSRHIADQQLPPLSPEFLNFKPTRAPPPLATL
jgi:hypothetical protein